MTLVTRQRATMGRKASLDGSLNSLRRKSSVGELNGGLLLEIQRFTNIPTLHLLKSKVSISELVINEVGLWYSNIYDCKSQADSVKNAFGEVFLYLPLIH